MKFRTVIEIPKSDFQIRHSDKIVMLGSCFTENIGERLLAALFNADINPFGTLYNPASIAEAVERLADNRPFSRAELFEHAGMWHSFSHHSRFSSVSPDRALQNMNGRFSAATDAIRSAQVLVITFGTAFVYTLAETGRIVANCHKLPASRFCRRRLSSEEITACWQTIIQQLKAINPALRIIFTVSPIRHFADGAHGNQLSKSVLLLATESLVAGNSGCSYFPAYEIMLDELRDYRFFTADMTHPSETAADYIFERFADTYFSHETRQTAAECLRLTRRLGHRPMNGSPTAVADFSEKTERLLQGLAARLPYLAAHPLLRNSSTTDPTPEQ